MLKRLSKLFLPAVILIAAIYISGCSSSLKIQNPVVGIIKVVGNDPFIQLAVNVNDKDVYLLECPREITDELLKNQQRVYEIIYSDVKETEQGVILVVKKAIQVKTK